MSVKLKDEFLSFYEVQRLIAQSTREVVSEDLCESPLVSVLLMTYQHREFIEESLDSVLEQKTDFPYEIVVGDDGSTDGTYEILREYQKRYPDKIRLFRSEVNLGAHTGNGRLNVVRNMMAARGEFVALLEGDDFWSFDGKLQAQWEFMRNNPECEFCFHNVYILDEEKGETRLRDVGVLGQFVNIEKMVTGYIGQTASYFFKNNFDLYEESWFYRIDAADRVFCFFYTSKVENAGYIDEAWSTWRQRSGTATDQLRTDMSRHYRGQIEVLFRLQEKFERDLSKQIDYVMWLSVKRPFSGPEVLLSWKQMGGLIFKQLSLRKRQIFGNQRN